MTARPHSSTGRPRGRCTIRAPSWSRSSRERPPAPAPTHRRTRSRAFASCPNRRPRRRAAARSDDDVGRRTVVRGEGLATKSYRPDPLPAPGEMPPGTFMRKIAERGRLVVGVDENTLGLLVPQPDHGRDRGLRGRPGLRDREAHLRRARPQRDRPDGPGRHATRRCRFARDGRVDLTISAISMTLRSLGGRRLQRRVLHRRPAAPRPQGLRHPQRRRPGRPHGLRHRRFVVVRHPAGADPGGASCGRSGRAPSACSHCRRARSTPTSATTRSSTAW